jgi:hypothetical protein
MFIVDKNNEEFLEELAKLHMQGKSISVLLHTAVRIATLNRVLKQILTNLPTNKNWLDPEIESEARTLTGLTGLTGIQK